MTPLSQIKCLEGILRYMPLFTDSPLALSLESRTYHYFNLGCGSTMWDENRLRALTGRAKSAARDRESCQILGQPS